MDRIERKLHGVKPGVTLEGVQLAGYLPKEVEQVVDEMVIRYRQTPANPYLERETGIIVKERYGTEIDSEKTVENLFNADPGAKLRLVRVGIPAKHRAAELQGLHRTMGSFHTWFYGSWERHQNIVMAIGSINNHVLWPDETFSFNQVVGPRTPERGYRLAPVLGGDGLGFGGGICQVSTTIYNAALEAGLEVTERSPHSSRVPYIAAGKDAAVVYGAQDLKFKNNYRFPVIISCSINRGKITAEIMGK